MGGWEGGLVGIDDVDGPGDVAGRAGSHRIGRAHGDIQFHHSNLPNTESKLMELGDIGCLLLVGGRRV